MNGSTDMSMELRQPGKGAADDAAIYRIYDAL